MSYAALVGVMGVICVGSAAVLLLPNFTVVEPGADEVGERLVTPDDMRAVRAAFDEMLVSKGLVTGDQIELIRHGAKSRAVVTGMRATGETREDHREVELAVMVRRLGGGQFPAHEKALVPASSLARVSPGSVVDAYYRPGDESAIAVCVPPR
jgi:hypothetical protein